MGRKRSVHLTHYNMRTAIGIDLGGSKIEVIRCTTEGRVEESKRIHLTGTETKDALIDLMVELLHCIPYEDTVGIGLAHPGFIDNEGVLRNTPNLPYLEGSTNFIQLLSQRAGKPVVSENDANCFALAEYHYGAARGCSSMMGVIWGTGVGGGVIIDGKLLKGAFGGGGEIGHTIIHYDSRKEKYMDIEELCTGIYPIERYYALGGMHEDINREYLFEQASVDAAAQQIRGELLNHMAVALSNWAHVIQPEVIVFGGGVSNTDMYDELNHLFHEYVKSQIGDHIRILPHSLSDAAGALGAASLVLGTTI